MFHKKLKQMTAWLLAFGMVMGSAQFPAMGVKAADGNLALTATATASSVEANTLPARYANDGNNETRWASAVENGVQTLQLSWNSVQTMKSFVIRWERRNATGYAVETSNDGTNWTAAASFTAKPTKTVQEITLNAPVQAQYVRLNITSHTADGLENETSWNNVSIYEFEVYEGEIPDDRTEMERLMDSIEAPQVLADGTKITMPEIAGADVRFCADYEQVIGEDGTIYTPLEDKVVKGFYEVTKGEETGKTEEFAVTVPGKYQSGPNDNEKPSVIPELQEWHGDQGRFAVSGTSKIVADQELEETAKKFAADYKEMTGSEISVVTGGLQDALAGDFYLTLNTSEQGLGKEGYVLKIGSTVVVEASEETGAYWGTISILQILKQTQGVIAKGTARDYPKYEVRGFSLDLGRKPFDLNTVYDFAKNMSWYKMNSLQLHLSDNLIFHEDYPDLETAAAESYAGFRLESDKKNDETGVTLTSQDMYYTKEEFKEFITDTQARGVNIVPEFDMPAHALAITRVYEQYMSKKTGGSHGYLIEELNLENEESFAWAKSIWQEYFEGGEDAVFADIETVHIGTDEYHGTDGQTGKELFRRFSKEMIEYVEGTKTADGKARTVRMWGSLTNKSGETPVPSEGVQLNIWNTGYANPKAMYDLGYDLINTLEGPNYIVPAAGYYNDYINAQSIYNTWQPNVIGNLSASAGDDQILGGCYAIWHDSVDTRANGISEYDSFDRFFQPLPSYGAKLWGEAEDRTYAEFTKVKEKTGTAPGTEVYGEVKSATGTALDYTFDETLTKDASANGYDAADSKNVSQADSDSSKALKLNGGESYLTTADEVNKIGSNTTLTMRVKMDEDAQGEQILCESKDEFGAYGTYAIKASQKNTGKVGFSREGYDYSFDYTLPKGEWVELTFKGGKEAAALYVNGELVDNDPEIYFANHPTTELTAKLKRHSIRKICTMMIPMGRIGSTTNSFKGLVDRVTVGTVKEIKGDYSSAAVSQSELTAGGCSTHATEGSFEALLDGNPATYWHTNYALPTEKDDTKDHNHYITLTFKDNAAKTINMLSYLPRQDNVNGRISQYSIDITKADGTVITDYASGTWTSDMTEKIAVFDAVEAKSVKLNILASEGNHGTAAEMNLYYVDADKNSVAEALKPYTNLNSSDYTVQSWAAFREALATIEAIVSNPNSTNEDNFVAYGMMQSLDGLLVEQPAETAVLQAVTDAEKVNLSGYRADSVAVFQSALAEVKKILENPNATLKQSREALSKLAAAKAGLVEPADVNAVSKAVADAEKVNLDGYTADSVAAFKNALAQAKKILTDPNATLEQSREALSKLAAAKAALKKAGDIEPPFNNNTKATAGNGRYQVVDAKKQTAKLIGVVNKKATKMNVPATVKIQGRTCTVVEVGAKAFKGNTKLKKVILGKNVTTIGKQAFSGCKNLSSVQLKGKALKKIGSQAFKKTSAKLTVSAKKMNKKQKAALLRNLKKAGASKKTKVR